MADESSRAIGSIHICDLPRELLELIAIYLNGIDVVYLGFTCKLFEKIAQTELVWKELVLRRFGPSQIPRPRPANVQSSSPDSGSPPAEVLDQSQEQDKITREEEPNQLSYDYKKLYFQLSCPKKPVAEGNILWLNNSYLCKEEDSTSYSKTILKLNRVCWLDLVIHFPGTLTGSYDLIWCMKLNNCSVLDTSIFEVFLHGSSPKEILFQMKKDYAWWSDLEQKNKSDLWFEITVGRFQVDKMSDLVVQLRNHSGTWKYGIRWDFVWLKPVTLEALRDNKSAASASDKSVTEKPATTEHCTGNSNNETKQKRWKRLFKRK